MGPVHSPPRETIKVGGREKMKDGGDGGNRKKGEGEEGEGGQKRMETEVDEKEKENVIPRGRQREDSSSPPRPPF